MKLAAFFRPWWMILIQGILLIALSIFIFGNPETVITALAFWLGFAVFFTGVVGIVAYFINRKEGDGFYSLLGSSAISLIGILMILKLFATIKAITVVFGILLVIVAVMLISGSVSIRKRWPYWWILTILGCGALLTGFKSIMDVYLGVENLSIIIGLSVLFSGIGMVCLAFIKKIITKVSSESLS
ncbi:MAG: DUF308 domain-containing protein [bacterium]|nr:DUF308 domain-containing protein [bacterium]